ncbi:MAG: hypothetical protein HY040_22160 [Planctomycetes bacterium]|nr:hypothetical protein [Planctomycetota bacterium]
MHRFLLSIVIAAAWVVGFAQSFEAGEPATGLRFEVTVAKDLAQDARAGRLFVVIAGANDKNPRRHIGEPDKNTAPYLGVDVKGLSESSRVLVGQKAAIFPVAHLAKLPAGKYKVQAVFHGNRDLNIPDAPGNLYSEPVVVELDPSKGDTVSLVLSKKVAADEPPADTEYVKYLKVPSELLSKFHGRPMYHRAAVILPRDFDKNLNERYPLWVRIGGYGTRYTAPGRMMSGNSGFRKLWQADSTPRMILLHLDGAGPYGDPYQVNSANNGPYGDALINELIPLVEKKFRGIGQGDARVSHARVVEGHSTGGWVSLALQVFYPDFFNGCWSHAPDPVDFRAYEKINIYSDDNAFVNAEGKERPASRNKAGKVLTTVPLETRSEIVLGRGNRWELSGKDWCAWNAVFGPRGDDGLPRPLWDGKTGKIDQSVLNHWRKYDLRYVLEENWPALAPKLKGKIRIWVGEADDYFLNEAVHLLDAFLSKAQPAYEGRITYAKGQGHGWRGLSDRQMMEEMAAAMAKGSGK